jgi:hypothetical protein
MDDYDDWGDLDDGLVAEAWGPAVLREATATTMPSHTALFRRDRETLWINAYPLTRVVTLTYPPVPLPDYDKGEQVRYVKEIRAGAGTNIVDVFYSLTADAIAGDWQRVPCGVWSGDPWSTPSVLDEGPTF